MKKTILLLALFLSFAGYSQNILTLDKLYLGDNIAFTYQPFSALGTGGTVEVYGNAVSGRIVINTGTGCTGNTPCAILFPVGQEYPTDNLKIFIQGSNGTFKVVQSAGVAGNYFEIYSLDAWTDSTSYEFNYFIIAHIE